MADSGRQALLQKAVTAEAGGCFRYATVYMRELVEMNVALTKEERQTLSVSYNKSLTECVAGARKLKDAIAQCEESRDPAGREAAAALVTLRRQLLAEIRNICSELSTLIAAHLLPSTSSIDSEVFYKKWQGDLFRVAAENVESPSDPLGPHFTASAQLAYQAALNQAALELQPTDLTRLCLALHYATFTAEALEDLQGAVDLAERAIEEAAAEWPSSSGFGKAHISNYKETVTVLHLLHQNAELWLKKLKSEQTPEGTPAACTLDSGVLDDFELGMDGAEEAPEPAGRPPLVAGYATIKATLQESRKRAEQMKARKK